MLAHRMLSVSLSVLVFPTLSLLTYAQAAQTQSSPGQMVSRVAQSGPAVVTECEGIDNCTSWTFLNQKGYGRWRTGEEAVLEVESLAGNQIVISRTDVTGSRQGLTATYKGILKDDRVSGEYTSVYQGQTEVGNWYWKTGKEPAKLPDRIQACSAGHCLVYKRENGLYYNYTNLPCDDNPGRLCQQNEKRVLTIRSLTDHSIVISETDDGSFPLTAEWKGEIGTSDSNAAQGTMLITTWKGKAVAYPDPISFTLSWGPHIDTTARNEDQSFSTGNGQAQPLTATDLIQGAKNLRDAIELFQFFAAFLP